LKIKEVRAAMTDFERFQLYKAKQARFKLVKKMIDLKAGQTAPMGFFDPLGISGGASPERIAFLREVEVKHGRVCMWASIGYLYGELFHPFFGGDLSGPSYMYATYAPMNLFWGTLAIAIAIPEVFGSLPLLKGPGAVDAERIPGDLGFDPLRLKESFDFLEMQNKELNNGRLAMLGVAGMYAQEIATGKSVVFDVAGTTGMKLLDVE